MNVEKLNKLTKEQLIDLASNLFKLLKEAQSLNLEYSKIFENIKTN